METETVVTIAVVISLLSCLAALISAWHAARTACIMKQQFDREYRPDLYIWPLRHDEQSWTWKVINAGRGPAWEVLIAAHWGHDWQAPFPVWRLPEDGIATYPRQSIAMLLGRASLEFELPYKEPNPIKKEKLVVRTEWTDLASNQPRYRCWEIRWDWDGFESAGEVSDMLVSRLKDNPACEECPVHKKGLCPLKTNDKSSAR